MARMRERRGPRKVPTTRLNQSKHHQPIIPRSFNEDHYEMVWPGGMREAFKSASPPRWCDERVWTPLIGKNSLLGINTGSAHSAGPGGLGPENDEGFTFFVLGRRRVHSSPFVRGCHIACFVLGRRRVHIFRCRAPKGSQFTLRSGLKHRMFRPRASKGSYFSSSGAEGFTFSSSGPEGFTFFVLGCGRVRVSHPRAPKGSHFPSLGAEGFTFLVLVRRRVHTSRPRVSKGSHFPHAGGPGARGFDFSPRRPEKNLVLKKRVFPTCFQIKNAIFGCWPL